MKPFPTRPSRPRAHSIPCTVHSAADPHYSLILHWWIHLPAKNSPFNSEVHTRSASKSCADRAEKGEKKKKRPNLRIPNLGPVMQHFASCFRSQTKNEYPFHGLFSATSSTFLCFFMVISLSKMSPGIVLKGYPVFLSTEKSGNALYRENTSVWLAFFRHEIIGLLAIWREWIVVYISRCFK